MKLAFAIKINGSRVYFDLACHRRGEASVIGESEQCDSCGGDIAETATARPGLWHQKAAIVCECGHEYVGQTEQVAA